MSNDTMEAILNDCTISPKEYCYKYDCGQGIYDELADYAPDMCIHLVGRAVAATRHERACPHYDAKAHHCNIHDEEPETDELTAEHDEVNHPSHYTQGGIECIDAMRSMAVGALCGAFAGYLWLNAMKYLWRWPHKGRETDLRKARWYIDALITEISGKAGQQ